MWAVNKVLREGRNETLSKLHDRLMSDLCQRFACHSKVMGLLKCSFIKKLARKKEVTKLSLSWLMISCPKIAEVLPHE
jgi:hypothetical protein